MADTKKASDDMPIKSKKRRDTRDTRDGPIKLTNKPPKIINFGNWKDGQASAKKSKVVDPLTIAWPHVKELDHSYCESFATGRPMIDIPDLKACKHCKKTVLTAALLPHIARCLKVKKEKAQRKKLAREAREKAKAAEEEARRIEEGGEPREEETDVDKKRGAGKTSKKPAGKKLDGEAKGKKRKADGDAEKAPKSKKKKEEPKAKVVKPRGPVDVEKQCGVPLANGQPCARSLTCKSHSMGAKRAVGGRTMPYDMLLAAYQKKNQAKQQKAALDANAPLEDDEDANIGPVDAEEEAHLVMTALKNWKPVPVVPPVTFAPMTFEYRYARMRDLLNHATNGGRTNIFKVTSFGSQKMPERPGPTPIDDDAPGEEEPVPAATSSKGKTPVNATMQQPQRPSASGRA